VIIQANGIDCVQVEVDFNEVSVFPLRVIDLCNSHIYNGCDLKKLDWKRLD